MRSIWRHRGDLRQDESARHRRSRDPARVADQLVGREELLKEVWGPAYAKETHYLRVYLAQLRRKLEDDPSHPVHLLTEAGMGYRFHQ